MWAYSDCGELDLGFIPGKNHAPPSPSPWEPPRWAEPIATPALLSRASRQGVYAGSGERRANLGTGNKGSRWHKDEMQHSRRSRVGRVWVEGADGVCLLLAGTIL